MATLVFKSTAMRRMAMNNALRAMTVVLVLTLSACLTNEVQVAEIKTFPTDNMDAIITRSDVSIDKEISSNGKSSVKMIANSPTTFKLFETGPIDVDNARLIYKAKVRTDNVKGQAFLEMWCSFPGKGEFFSRGLQNPMSGTNGWTSVETPFFLKKGEKPDNVKLNVVVDGTGTVWIDDVKLMKGPLQ